LSAERRSGAAKRDARQGRRELSERPD